MKVLQDKPIGCCKFYNSFVSVHTVLSIACYTVEFLEKDDMMYYFPTGGNLVFTLF